MTRDERLLRQTNAQLAETGRHIRELASRSNEQYERYQAESREQTRRLREEMAARDRITDERIAELVSAIGAFIRKAS